MQEYEPQGPSLGPLLAACAVGVFVTMSLGSTVQVPRGLLVVTLVVSVVSAGWALFGPVQGEAT